MKLMHKLILGFLAVALLSSVTGYFALQHSKKILKAAFIENTEALTIEILDGLERDIIYKINELKGVTFDVTLQNEVQQSNRKFERLNDIKSYIKTRDREWISLPKGQLASFMQEIPDPAARQDQHAGAKDQPDDGLKFQYRTELQVAAEIPFGEH